MLFSKINSKRLEVVSKVKVGALLSLKLFLEKVALGIVYMFCNCLCETSADDSLIDIPESITHELGI